MAQDKRTSDLDAATSAADTDVVGGYRPGSPNTDLKFLVGLIRAVTEAVKTGAYTLAATDNRQRITFTTAATLTVPAAATLGAGFGCTVIADGVAVTIDGPGASNVSMSAEDRATIEVANGKVRVVKAASTVIS